MVDGSFFFICVHRLFRARVCMCEHHKYIEGILLPLKGNQSNGGAFETIHVM